MAVRAPFPKKAKEADSKEANAWFQEISDRADAAVTTVAGTTGEIDVTLSVPTATVGLADDAILPGIEGTVVPRGTTAERPSSPTEGTVRFNTTISSLEVFQDGDWKALDQVDSASTDEQKAATITNKYGSPGTQVQHPTSNKAWIVFDGVTPAILSSYNISSLTDNGTGDFTITFSVTFNSTAELGLSNTATLDADNSPTAFDFAYISTYAETVNSVSIAVGSGDVGLGDPTRASVSAFGVLA